MYFPKCVHVYIYNIIFMECSVYSGTDITNPFVILTMSDVDLLWPFPAIALVILPAIILRPEKFPKKYSWWRYQMETFSALLTICAGNSPVPGEFPAQRPVTWNFDVFFDLRTNKLLNKQSWGWWFETPSRPLRRHRNVENISQWKPLSG